MEPRTKHIIKDRSQYLKLVPQAEVKTYVLKKTGARLTDTINFIKFVLPLVAYQTEQLSKILTGNSPYEVCRAIFNWIYDHIEYRKDETGKEQIKSPQRTIYDGYGDCDDMQVLACSILANKKIPFAIRTTVYDETIGVQHIYPYAILGNRLVIMDCVAQRFDYEVPYLKKYDYQLPYINYNNKMELQFLNGTPEQRSSSPKRNIDADDLLEGYSEDEIGELGKKGAVKAKIHNAAKKVQSKVQNSNIKNKVHNVAQKVKNSKAMQAAKKGLHVVNRVNPAAALLRTGILIGLKTNMFKIAEALRFTYLTPQQVQAKGLDVNKVNRLTGIRQKLEKIFFAAGGLVENFKKNILTGKGNRDKQVPLSGLGSIDFRHYTKEHTPRQILGIATYDSEVGGVEGFGELGVAATAAVAAATSALTAIAALIKSIGSLKKDKSGSGDGSNQQDQSSNASDTSSDNGSANSTQDNSPSQADNTSNSQTQDDTGSGNDPQSNGGGAENKSTQHRADTSAATNTAEGSTANQNQANENSDSSGETDNSNSSGSAAEGGEENTNAASARSRGENAPSTKEVAEETMVTKVVNWAKENKLAATGVGILVVGGITLGLVKLFSKKQEGNHSKVSHQVAGLPRRKKSKHFDSSKFRVMQLK